METARQIAGSTTAASGRGNRCTLQPLRLTPVASFDPRLLRHSRQLAAHEDGDSAEGFRRGADRTCRIFIGSSVGEEFGPDGEFPLDQPESTGGLRSAPIWSVASGSSALLRDAYSSTPTRVRDGSAGCAQPWHLVRPGLPEDRPLRVGYRGMLRDLVRRSIPLWLAGRSQGRCGTQSGLGLWSGTWLGVRPRGTSWRSGRIWRLASMRSAASCSGSHEHPRRTARPRSSGSNSGSSTASC